VSVIFAVDGISPPKARAGPDGSSRSEIILDRRLLTPFIAPLNPETTPPSPVTTEPSPNTILVS